MALPSNTFHVTYSKRAEKALDKMDPFDRRTVLSWIGKHLEGSRDPRLHGRALTGSLASAWRYRVGDYRIIAEIKDREVLLLILEIGNRRSIYRKK